MKKAISLLLALVLCLSLCACGSNYQKQAEEVAPKLDGKWGRSWTAPLGTMYQVYIFEFEDGNSGTAVLYNQVDDTPMSAWNGTFSVSTKKDGIIDLSFHTFVDNSGADEPDEPMEMVVHYTYKNGNLSLTDDEENTLISLG